MATVQATAIQDATITSSIVYYTNSRDILSLLLTCRVFREPAERSIYDTLFLQYPQIVPAVCHTLSNSPRIASYVRSFSIVNRDVQFAAEAAEYIRPVDLHKYYEAVRDALANMVNLQSMSVVDLTGLVGRLTRESFTWILPQNISPPLVSATIYLPWDTRADEWLKRQTKLHHLAIGSLQSHYNPSHSSSPPDDIYPRNPLLTRIEAPVPLGIHLFHNPLTHVLLTLERLEDEDLLFTCGARLAALGRTLRALSVMPPMQRNRGCEMLRFIARCLPNLSFVGVIALPPVDRTAIHSSLMLLHSLSTIGIDVSHWEPFPLASMQRALAYELHMFCPTLRTVIVWLRRYRYMWRWSEEIGMWTGGEERERIAGMLWKWA